MQRACSHMYGCDTVIAMRTCAQHPAACSVPVDTAQPAHRPGTRLRLPQPAIRSLPAAASPKTVACTVRTCTFPGCPGSPGLLPPRRVRAGPRATQAAPAPGAASPGLWASGSVQSRGLQGGMQSRASWKHGGRGAAHERVTGRNREPWNGIDGTARCTWMAADMPDFQDIHSDETPQHACVQGANTCSHGAQADAYTCALDGHQACTHTPNSTSQPPPA